MRGLRRSALAVTTTAVFLGMSTSWSGAGHAAEQTETPLERVNALVQPSIVYLQQDWSGYVYDKTNRQYLNNGKPFELSFQCTGFVVNPDGYIATAGHCVDQNEVLPSFYETAAQWAVDNEYYENSFLTVDDILGFQAYRVDTETKRNRADLVIQVGWGASASGIDTAEVKRARIISRQPADAGDVALLKVEASDLNAVPMSDEEVEVGTEVVSVGFPASVDSVTDPDLTPSYKDGSISSVKTVQGGLLTVYEISAAVSGGMSGGPTVDLDGEVVGVNSFGILGESQQFNFVRPAGQMRELLGGAGVENEVSETTQAYRDGLAAFWAGEKEAAVDKLTLVVDEQPANELAADYLDKAEALPDPVKPPAAEGGGFPVLPVAVGGGALLLAVAVAGLLLARRRKGGTPASTVPTAPAGPPTTAASAPSTPTTGQLATTSAPLPPVADETPAAAPVPAGQPPNMPVGFGSGVTVPPTTVPPTTVPPAPVPPAPAPVAAPAQVEPPAGAPTALAPPPPADAVPTPKFCSNCGSGCHEGMKFCDECGTPLAH